jgi:transcription elongation GreA/GreB family factor
MTEVSPVGQEIIGKMSGDVVELSLNGHKEIIYILSVKEE